MNTKSITIIGSGINSFFFIKTILKKGYKVNLIDIDTDTETLDQRKINYKNNISPKITLKNFEDKIEIFKKYNKFSYNNFDNQSALSIGGLSNVWGGTTYMFNEHELIKNKLYQFKLDNYFKYLDNEKFLLKKQKFDNYFEKNVNKNYYNIKYNNLLLSNDNEPLNVKENIKSLIKQNKIRYISGFVENIYKNGDKYKLSILSNNKIHTFSDQKIVLAAGSLSTTRLLMQLLKVNSIRLLCTPSTQSVFLSSRRQLGLSLNSLLTFNKNNKDDITSSIFPLKGLNSQFFLDYIKINLKLAIPIINYFKQYVYGIYTYHSSDYSNIEIKNNNENYTVEGFGLNYSDDQLNNFYNKKMIKIPLTDKNLLQGIDNHIGGSFPLEKYFNNFNELNNFKNLYVIDGTYLNYIPPLGYTLITILNSIRIAEKIANEV